jgi:hypothetical protein
VDGEGGQSWGLWEQECGGSHDNGSLAVCFFGGLFCEVAKSGG